MAEEKSEYGKYFGALQKVNVSILLGDGNAFDSTADVLSLDGDTAWLKLSGGELPPLGSIRDGADVSISQWVGGALCCCGGTIVKFKEEGLVCVRLSGPVRELQRREFFRLDLSLPVSYKFLGTAPCEGLEAQWQADKAKYSQQPKMVKTSEGFKVVDWGSEGDILPMKVNLSGGGLRFKVSEHVDAGTLVALTLFLPLAQPRVVCAVAELLRCQEITLRWERGIYYSLSMKFIHLDDKDRESIISLLFNEQRRGLLEKKARISTGVSL